MFQYNEIRNHPIEVEIVEDATEDVADDVDDDHFHIRDVPFFRDHIDPDTSPGR